jgi:hypothetical protein
VKNAAVWLICTIPITHSDPDAESVSAGSVAAQPDIVSENAATVAKTPSFLLVIFISAPNLFTLVGLGKRLPS